MAKDASMALDAAQVAGTLVSLRTRAPDMPRFGRIGYLAASDSELVLTKTSQLGFKPQPRGDALVRVPRSEVASAAIEHGRILSHLTLRFANGSEWAFEIARLNRQDATELVQALGGGAT
jgi:hypothetical protein